MKSKITLAIASLTLSMASPWRAEAQTNPPTPIAPFEPPTPVDFDGSHTVHCGMELVITWRTRNDRSEITHMSLGSVQPSAAQLARFNSWVGRLRGDLAVTAACADSGATITFWSLSDFDNEHEVQFDWLWEKDRLLLEPPPQEK